MTSVKFTGSIAHLLFIEVAVFIELAVWLFL